MRGLTKEQVRDRLTDYTKDKYTIIGEYKGNMTPFEVECNDCGYRFSRSLKNFSKCKTCRGCNKNGYRLTHEEAKEEFEKLIEGVEVVGVYRRERDPVALKYPCGCILKKTLGNLRSGRGLRCEKCDPHRLSPEYRGKLKEASSHKLKNLAFGSFTIVGNYFNGSSPCSLKCDRCNTVFEDKIHSVIQRNGRCPHCIPSFLSLGEQLVATILGDLGFSFEREFRLGGKIYDFVIKDSKVLIEYDGSQHSEGWKGCENDKVRQAENDTYKDLVAKENGYTLIRIPDGASVAQVLVNKLT